MGRQHSEAILAAEAGRVNAENLWRCLLPLGQQVFLATSSEEAFRMLHRQRFRRAVVAAELAIDGEPLLSRLSRLSGMECLVAVGAGDNADMEQTARVAGANVYVARPVTTELLSKALRLFPAGRPDKPAYP